jgi:hypothetical protein
MSSNVTIQHRRRGELVGRQELHNVWTRYGQLYLTQMLGAAWFGGDPENPLPSDPVIVERSDRLYYMGLGMGGSKQSSPLVSSPPLSASYPVGFAELAYAPSYGLYGYSNGTEYNTANPTSPLIKTLERPVRVSGGSLPYASAPGTDVWRVGPPSLYLTHLSTQDVTVHALVDATAGDVVYAPFTTVPVSEAGLFLNTAGTSAPYANLVAYVTFDTILLEAIDDVEFIWQVRFG